MAGTIKLTVNGATVVLDEQPGEMLADLLRSRFGSPARKSAVTSWSAASARCLWMGGRSFPAAIPRPKRPEKK